MKYRRVLLVPELGHDARAEVATIRRVAPEADLLVVIARLPARKFAWFSGEAPGDHRVRWSRAISLLSMP